MIMGVIGLVLAMFVLWSYGFERTILSIMFPLIAPFMLWDWYKRRGRLTD